MFTARYELGLYSSDLFSSSNGQLRHPFQSSIHLSYFAVCSLRATSYVNYTETDRSLSHCAMKCLRQAAVCFSDFPIFVTVK